MLFKQLNDFELYQPDLSSNYSDLSDIESFVSFDNNVNDAIDTIAQIDGMDDLVPSGTSGFPKLGRAFSAPTDAAIKVAAYKLNPKKQLNKLKQDSRLIDFEITVSNKEHSVSVLCSTGFYTLVAVPAFSNTRVGTTHHVGNITMYCYDTAVRIDDVGCV